MTLQTDVPGTSFLSLFYLYSLYYIYIVCVPWPNVINSQVTSQVIVHEVEGSIPPRTQVSQPIRSPSTEDKLVAALVLGWRK